MRGTCGPRFLEIVDSLLGGVANCCVARGFRFLAFLFATDFFGKGAEFLREVLWKFGDAGEMECSGNLH